MLPNPQEIPKDTTPISETVVKERQACEYFEQQYDRVNDPATGKTSMDKVREVLGEVASDPEMARAYPLLLAEAAIEGQQWVGYKPTRGVPVQRTGIAVRGLAAHARKTLQCGTCVMAPENVTDEADSCPAPSVFDRIDAAERRDAAWDVLEEAPEWFMQDVLHRKGLTFEDYIRMSESPEQAERDGFTVEWLLDGVSCTRVDPLQRDQLPPELADHLTSAQNATAFPRHLLRFPNEVTKNVFLVSNLIDDLKGKTVNGYKGILPTEQVFGDLITTLVNWMKAEVKEDHKPFIVSAHTERQIEVARIFTDGQVVKVPAGSASRLLAAVQLKPIKIATGEMAYRVGLLAISGDSKEDEYDLFRDTGLNDLKQPGVSSKKGKKRG